ncbi:MAG TPA: ATP-binding protein [Flavobacteriales bacterium]|nr:ATP-binding protein [Flavobacteriales bacterium]
MDEERSPFLIGTLVSGSNFVNREWARKHLRANFRSGQNTVLISPRRWGKSSLIKQVALDMAREKSVRFAFVDLFQVRTEQEFLERTTEAAIKALGRTMEQHMADVKEFIRGVVPQISFGLDPLNEFSLKLNMPEGRRGMQDLLDLPERMAKAKGLRLVLCLDEFQNIMQLPDPKGFQKMLRATWQHHEHVCHVIYGSKRHMMMDLFNKQSMPFFRFGDVMFLDKIKREEWVPFIKERFASARISIAEEVCEHLASRMQDHSYHVQMLGHAAWLRTNGRKCSRTTVDTALQDLLNQHDALYHRLVDELTTPQLNYLRALLNDVKRFTTMETIRRFSLGSSAHVKRMTMALENKEVLDFQGEQTEWIDPLFKIWLEERYWGGRLRMV